MHTNDTIYDTTAYKIIGNRQILLFHRKGLLVELMHHNELPLYFIR